MANVSRWEPFQEMMSLRSAMDRVFDDAFQSLGADGNGNGNSHNVLSLALDVSENANEYIVRASVPGVAEDELDITLDNHVLTISGEFKRAENQRNVRFHLRERRYGKFNRSITLPSAVNEEKIEAVFTNGLLTIRVPKAEVAKPKRITVQSAK